MEYLSVSPSSKPLKLSLAVFVPPTEAQSDHESSLVCLKTLCLCSPLCIHLLLSLLLFVSPTLPPLCFDVDRSWFPSFTWIFIFFKSYNWIKIKFTCLCSVWCCWIVFGINIVFSCGYPWIFLKFILPSLLCDHSAHYWNDLGKVWVIVCTTLFCFFPCHCSVLSARYASQHLTHSILVVMELYQVQC